MQLWSLATRPCTCALLALFIFRKRASSAPASAGVAFTGDCWDQWNQFWTANQSLSYLTEWSTSTLIETSTLVSAKVDFSTYTTSYASVYSTVETLHDGQQGSWTWGSGTPYTISYTTTYSGPASSPISTEPTRTVTRTEYITRSYPDTSTITANLATPKCTLPSPYPLCQSQWDNFIAEDGFNNNEPYPLCSQAAIDSAQCDSMVSEYYAGDGTFGATGIPGWVTSASSTWWPTQRSFAPGCTLGCQTCAITGNTVQLLYWPPNTATAFENGTMTARVSLQRGSHDVVTAVFDGTTLTSPTVYVSYKALYASNSCSGIGRTYNNTIVALTNTNDLSSLAYHPLSSIAPQPGMSGVEALSWDYEPRPFNFSNLIEPIPNSIYDQLPYCQEQLRGYESARSAGVDPASFSCTRQGPYAPLIAVPTEIRNLNPDWKSCTAWYGGLFDPPIALQGRGVETTLTAIAAAQAISAQPSSTAGDGIAKETGVPAAQRTSLDPQWIGRSSSETATTIASSVEAGAISAYPSDLASDPDIRAHSSAALVGGTEQKLPTTTNALSVLSAARDPQAASGAHATDTTRGAAISVGGTIYTAEAQTSGGVIIDGASFSAGETTVMFETMVSIESSQIVVDGITQLYSTLGSTGRVKSSVLTTTSPVMATFTANGVAHTVQISSGRLGINGATLTPGETTVIGDNTIRVGSSSVLIDGTAYPLTATRTAPHASTTAYNTIRPSSTGVITTNSETYYPEAPSSTPTSTANGTGRKLPWCLTATFLMLVMYI